jgi:hypothetical protein
MAAALSSSPVMFVVSLASRSDYPFTRIAICMAVINLLLFLLKDMLKCFLLRDRKWVAGTMCIGERETM